MHSSCTFMKMTKKVTIEHSKIWSANDLLQMLHIQAGNQVSLVKQTVKIVNDLGSFDLS